MKLVDLIQECYDKQSSINLLQRVNILPSSMLCANGHSMTLKVTDQKERWRCTLRTCREEKPLRPGTWLQGSRLPFRTVVLFIYFWSKDMASVRFCEDELDINHATVVDWTGHLREVCAWRLLTKEEEELDDCASKEKKELQNQIDTHLCEVVWRQVIQKENQCPFLHILKDISEFWLVKS